MKTTYGNIRKTACGTRYHTSASVRYRNKRLVEKETIIKFSDNRILFIDGSPTPALLEAIDVSIDKELETILEIKATKE